MNQKAKLGVSGAAAGLVNGLFGGGGGMVMAPCYVPIICVKKE